MREREKSTLFVVYCIPLQTHTWTVNYTSLNSNNLSNTDKKKGLKCKRTVTIHTETDTWCLCILKKWKGQTMKDKTLIETASQYDNIYNSGKNIWILNRLKNCQHWLIANSLYVQFWHNLMFICRRVIGLNKLKRYVSRYTVC